MTKERSSKRESKKKPAMSLKEKRAAKKAKKDPRPTGIVSENK